MIVTVAVSCVFLGFIAAAAVLTKPEKTNPEILWLLSSLRLVSRERYENILCTSLENGIDSSSTASDALKDGNLLTKEQVEADFEPSSWQALAYQDFRTKILAKGTGMKTFPCVYATMGYRAGDHRYIFLHSDNPAEPRNVRKIAPALQEYLRISKSLGPNTSLVIFGAPSQTERSVESYNNSFWDMLRGLRIADPNAWPTEVPESLASEKWTFCYGGEAVFPVMLTPAHSQRWSRHMSVPVIALQPKWVLDNLLSTQIKRDAAVGKVRKLLKEYDQVDVSPDLTSYGQPGTSEARQLCLLNENKTAEQPYLNLDS